MLRAGFFLGFLVGAGVASLFSDGDRTGSSDQVPGSNLVPQEDDTSLKGKFRAALREAKVAARQGAEQKERELMWQFEQMIRRR
jgi:hypothetical protein